MSTTSPPSAYQIERSVVAFQKVREMLEADQNFVLDEDEIGRLLWMTGDVHPRERLQRLIDAVILTDRRTAQADALRKHYTERKARYERRAAAMREQIVDLLAVLEMPACEADEGTAAMRRNPPSVVITDLEALPKEFVRVETIKTPLKNELSPVLKAGMPVPGAELSEQSFRLQITPF
jgi:hypothetical protein